MLNTKQSLPRHRFVAVFIAVLTAAKRLELTKQHTPPRRRHT